MSATESQARLFGLAVSNSNSATKTFEWRDAQTLRLESSYSAGSSFITGALPSAPGEKLDNIEDLANLVARVEANYPRMFIIRGVLRDALPNGAKVNRRYLPDPNRSAPSWQMHPEGPRWLMIDLDDLAIPEATPSEPDAEELAALVRYATEKLPPCFQGVTTFYQWSSSAGLEKCGEDAEGKQLYRRGFKTLRLHLWYWLDRGGYCPALRAWFKAWREQTGAPIDNQLYIPNQIHYVAAPIFKGGCDIFAPGTRSGILRGACDTVYLPDSVLSGSDWRAREAKQEAERKEQSKRAREQRRYQSQGTMLADATRYALAALDSAFRAIGSAGEGTRHDTIIRESYSIGGLVGGGHLQRETARADLEQAAFAVLPSSRHSEAVRTVRDGLTAGERSPRDIPQSSRRRTSPARPPSATKTPTPKPKPAPVVRVLGDAHFGSSRAEDVCSFPYGYNATQYDTERKREWKAYASRQTRERYYNPDKDIELLNFNEWIAEKSAPKSLAATGADTPNANDANHDGGI